MQIMNPISLHVIAKDNLENIKRMMESIRPYVSEIYILDTGCDYDAYDYLMSLNAKSNCRNKVFVVDGKHLISPETGFLSDFAAARNVTWNMGSQPYKMYLDTDDEFVGGQYISELISDFEKDQEPGAIAIDYRYGHDEKGNCVQCYPHSRIFKLNEMWKRCLHEYVDVRKYQKYIYKRDINNVCYVKHHTNGRGSSQVGNNRNLFILKEFFKNHSPNDEPHLFYYLLEEVKIRLQIGMPIQQIYVRLLDSFIESCSQLTINNTFEYFHKMNPAGAPKLIFHDEWLLYTYKESLKKEKKKFKWKRK